MRYYVLDRGDPLSVELTQQFHKLAEQRGLCWMQNLRRLWSRSAETVRSHAFHTFIDRIPDLAFVGVHTGHLGFYADWKADELTELIDHMSGKANTAT